MHPWTTYARITNILGEKSKNYLCFNIKSFVILAFVVFSDKTPYGPPSLPMLIFMSSSDLLSALSFCNKPLPFIFKDTFCLPKKIAFWSKKISIYLFKRYDLSGPPPQSIRCPPSPPPQKNMKLIKKNAVTRDKIIYLKAQQLQNIPLSQHVLYIVHGVYLLRLRVRVPVKSLFHDENFLYFYFGVRGTPKMLITFFGAPPKIFKKVGVLPRACRDFASAPKSSNRRARSRWAAKAKALPDASQWGKIHTFFKNLGGTSIKIFKILWLPLYPKS